MQTFKQRNQRVIVSVVMTIMMVLAMVPSMAFAAAGYEGYVDIVQSELNGLKQGSETALQADYMVDPETACHIDWSVEGCDSSVATISKHKGILTAVGSGAGVVKATLRLGEAPAGTGDQAPCTGEVIATDEIPFSVASNTAYGFQGISGNTVKLVTTSEVTVSEAPSLGHSRFLNVIKDPVTATANNYQFGYQLSAGFNRFDETTFNGYAGQINVHHIDTTKPDNVGAIAAGVTFDRFENGVAYINFEKSKLPAGSYILRFGPNVCGNNASKKLGINVDFLFTIK